MTQGKLEVTVKINELPESKTVENGWQQFEIDCDGFVLLEPNIQVFERKPKAEAAAAT